MTANVYLISHSDEMVRQFGPVWSYSTFVSESGTSFFSRNLPKELLHLEIK